MCSLREQFNEFKKEARKLKKNQEEMDDRIQKLLLEKAKAQAENDKLSLQNEHLKLLTSLKKNETKQLDETIANDEKKTKETEYKIVEIQRKLIVLECVQKLEKVENEQSLKRSNSSSNA